MQGLIFENRKKRKEKEKSIKCVPRIAERKNRNEKIRHLVFLSFTYLIGWKINDDCVLLSYPLFPLTSRTVVEHCVKCCRLLNEPDVTVKKKSYIIPFISRSKLSVRIKVNNFVFILFATKTIGQSG